MNKFRTATAKKVMAIILATSMLLGALLAQLMARPASSQEIASAMPVKVVLNGTGLALEDDPVIEDGRVLVPFRGIFEALGSKVMWIPDERAVVGELFDENDTFLRGVFLTIDSRTAIVGVGDKESEVTMDVPPRIINSRTFVPLRFVGESLGAEVNWDSVARTVFIESKHGNSDDDVWHEFSTSVQPGFSVAFPENWALSSENWPNRVAFSSPEGAEVVFTTEPSARAGGDFETVTDVVDILYDIYKDENCHVSERHEGTIGHYPNVYDVVSFEVQSPDFSNTQSVGVMQADEDYFLVVFYTADKNVHGKLLPLVYTMLGSFRLI